MATAAGPDADAVYLILKRWAEAKQVRTYTDLSNDYLAATGAWFEPHRSWDRPLGEVTAGSPSTMRQRSRRSSC